MKVFKASNIGSGVSIKYKALEFENNTRVTSPCTVPINHQSAGAIPKRYDVPFIKWELNFAIHRRVDRQHHDLSLCSISDCTANFESSVELDAHIATNLHSITEDVPRTANDIARIHLTEIVRSTPARSRKETDAIHQHHDTIVYDMSVSTHNSFFSTYGWALRTRKFGKSMTEKVKNFFEEL